jgi:hypothetical protein
MQILAMKISVTPFFLVDSSVRKEMRIKRPKKRSFWDNSGFLGFRGMIFQLGLTMRAQKTYNSVVLSFAEKNACAPRQNQ